MGFDLNCEKQTCFELGEWPGSSIWSGLTKKLLLVKAYSKEWTAPLHNGPLHVSTVKI